MNKIRDPRHILCDIKESTKDYIKKFIHKNGTTSVVDSYTLGSYPKNNIN